MLRLVKPADCSVHSRIAQSPSLAGQLHLQDILDTCLKSDLEDLSRRWQLEVFVPIMRLGHLEGEVKVLIGCEEGVLAHSDGLWFPASDDSARCQGLSDGRCTRCGTARSRNRTTCWSCRR